MDNEFAIGVDIGGSHIIAGAVDIKNKILLSDSLVRRKVTSDVSAAEIICDWADVIKNSNWLIKK